MHFLSDASLLDNPNNILNKGTNYEALHYLLFSIPFSFLPLSSKRPLPCSVPIHLPIYTAVFQLMALYSLRGDTRWPSSVLT
jgi:hypothetical protein